jgi:hypothetical protein
MGSSFNMEQMKKNERFTLYKRVKWIVWIKCQGKGINVGCRVKLPINSYRGKKIWGVETTKITLIRGGI